MPIRPSLVVSLLVQPGLKHRLDVAATFGCARRAWTSPFCDDQKCRHLFDANARSAAQQATLPREDWVSSAQARGYRASDSRRLYCRDRCHRRGGHRRRRSGLVHPAPGRPTKAPAPLTRFVKGVLSRPHLPRLPSLRMSSCAPRLSPGVAYRRRTQRWRRSRAVARAGNNGAGNNGPKRPASRAQPEAPRCAAPWPLLARHPRRARLSEKQPPY
jgi:hypothetical protein